MRRFAPLLVAILLGATGCKSWFKKDGTPGKPASRTRNSDEDPWWKQNGEGNGNEPFGPRGTESENTDRTTSRGQLDTLLAGRVLDDSNRPVADAFIQVSMVGDESRKPIGVNADRQGLFVVEGLRPGKSYELSARVEDGKRVLGQTVVVRAPNAKVLIRVSEAGVTSLTPAAQPKINEVNPFNQPPKEKEKPKSLPTPDPISGDPITPERTGDYSPSGNSSRGNSSPPPPVKKPANSNGDSSLIGGVDDPKRPIPATIPPPNPTPSRYGNPTPAPPPKAVPKPVTSSDNSLSVVPIEGTAPRFDFTLRGLQRDSEWKFSTASGRLVLLDFWSTTCPPCIRALPETNQIAATYASSGLEVVGIACEQPDTYEHQSNAVAAVSQRNKLKYGVYLDGDKNAVQKLFQVKSIPTMILLDSKGNVLWRGSGATRENFDALDAAIQKGLKRS